MNSTAYSTQTIITSTAYIKEATQFTIARRMMKQLFMSLGYSNRRFRKSSKRRRTVSDGEIPSSSKATLPSSRDLEDATESNPAVYDVVPLSETASELMNGDPDSDPISPDGEGQEPSPLPKSPCGEHGSEPGGNVTCTCIPAMIGALPNPLSPPSWPLPPAATSNFLGPNDNVSSIHSQASAGEGLQVEITQVKQEAAGDMGSDDIPQFHGSWGETQEGESGWGDSDVALLHDFSSTPPASTPPHPGEAEQVPTILLSSDSRMTLTLRNFLGAGTYGKVVSADWREGCRSVAVKVSHKLFISETDYTEQGLRHLENELEVLKALKQSRERCEQGSNFFPELFKSWQDAKNVYFVMEMYMCNLEDLRWADPDWDATTGDKILWAAEMILGLQALHRMRVLHRDIKPANVFITASKHIVIGDYGLARTWLDPFYANFPSTSLRARDSPGTLAYLAPEVVRGFYLDPVNVEVRKYANYGFEADIWSLGVTICESWSHNAVLFGVGEGESDLESKVIPPKILGMDIEPAVKGIVGGHPIWHLITRMLDRNPKARIGFDEMLAHPVFANLEFNRVANLEYNLTSIFPEVKPYKSPKRVGDEIEFSSFYQHPEAMYGDETDGERAKAERQLRRIAMGAARDWVNQQPTHIASGALWEHDFDWTAPGVIEEEEWQEDED